MNKEKKKDTLDSLKYGVKRRLSSYYAIMMSCLIAAIIILTMGFVFNHIKNLSVEYEASLKDYS